MIQGKKIREDVLKNIKLRAKSRGIDLTIEQGIPLDNKMILQQNLHLGAFHSIAQAAEDNRILSVPRTPPKSALDDLDESQKLDLFNFKHYRADTDESEKTLLADSSHKESQREGDLERQENQEVRLQVSGRSGLPELGEGEEEKVAIKKEKRNGSLIGGQVGKFRYSESFL